MLQFQKIMISLKDFAKDTYEIVAKFKPSEKTKKVGFRLRKNQNDTEYTDVIYDLENEKLSIDRSKSGKIISQEFKKINEQSNVKKNEDGSVRITYLCRQSQVSKYLAVIIQQQERTRYSQHQQV